MKKYPLVWGAAALVLGVVLASPAQVARAAAISNNATLVGSAAFPLAKGNAGFRADVDAPSTLSVAVENGTPPATINVSLAGVAIGSITLNRKGNGTMSVTGIAPPVAGKTITVRTDAGTLVVSGTF